MRYDRQAGAGEERIQRAVTVDSFVKQTPRPEHMIRQSKGAAGPQHPLDLPKSLGLIRPMVKRQAAHHQVHAAIRKGKPFGAGDLKSHIWAEARGFRDHPLCWIDSEQPRARPA